MPLSSLMSSGVATCDEQPLSGTATGHITAIVTWKVAENSGKVLDAAHAGEVVLVRICMKVMSGELQLLSCALMNVDAWGSRAS